MGTWQGINAGLQAFNQGALGLLRLDQQERENQGLAEVRKLQTQKIGNELLEYERKTAPIYLDDSNANRALIEEFPHFAEKDLAGKTFFRTENMAEARKTALSNPDIHARLWDGKLRDAQSELAPLYQRIQNATTADDPQLMKVKSEIEKKEAAAMEIKAQRDRLQMAALHKMGLLKEPKTKSYDLFQDQNGKPVYVEKGQQIDPGYKPYVKKGIVEHVGGGGKAGEKKVGTVDLKRLSDMVAIAKKGGEPSASDVMLINEAAGPLGYEFRQMPGKKYHREIAGFEIPGTKGEEKGEWELVKVGAAPSVPAKKLVGYNGGKPVYDVGNGKWQIGD